jgi:hypothetical protein
VKNLPLGALERAFSQNEIVVWNAELLNLNETEVGLVGSATRVWKLRPPPPRRGGEVLSGPPERLTELLLRKLEALSILDEEDGSD